MNELLHYSKMIKHEADGLLSNFKVIETIRRFGQVKFTGSYELDLMYKKDIDISLINDDLSVERFTQLGKELIDRMNTPSVFYRNTRVIPVERRPEDSLYWGIQSGEWFLDIWAMSNEAYIKAENYISDIKKKLTSENKIIILSLKDELTKNETYGKEFSSRELYDAVLNHNVADLSEFNAYIKSQSHLNEYR